MRRLFKRRAREFRLTYGVVLGGTRGHGLTDKVQEQYSIVRHGEEYPYFIDISVSSDSIKSLFLSLARRLDDEVKCHIFSDEDYEKNSEWMSEHIPLQSAIDVFEEYSFQIINDGEMSFGIHDVYREVRLDQHKRIWIFCSEADEFEEVIKEYGIPKGRKGKSVGECGHYHLSLGAIFHERLEKYMEPIPQEEIDKYNSDTDKYLDYQKEIISRLKMEKISIERNSP